MATSSLPPVYLRILMERFGADPELGLAGGVLVEPTQEAELRGCDSAPSCPRGAQVLLAGLLRRDRWRPGTLGWDTIDETYARMCGFATVSFEDLVSVHHRPWGTADGALRGRARLGECAYITHYPPLWVTLRAVKLACGRPEGIWLAFL